jgi:putative glutamine amidotransferase
MPAEKLPRIAIPMPHSGDREYAERSIPQYELAVKLAKGEAVRIPLDQSTEEVRRIVEECHAVLLPGSNADVDPKKFGEARSPHTAPADSRRDAVDELLLRDAYELRKPILGICYGLQSLNVYRSGSLVQHIPDFLPEDMRSRVNHEAGKSVPVAHGVEIESGSRLAEILCERKSQDGRGFNAGRIVPVNSSHHQSAGTIGSGLRLVARCVEDGIVEALEGTDKDHFVIAVQWHPERSVELDEPSRSIFKALVKAADLHRIQVAG